MLRMKPVYERPLVVSIKQEVVDQKSTENFQMKSLGHEHTISSNDQQVGILERHSAYANNLRMKPVSQSLLATLIEQDIIYKKSCENHQMRPLIHEQAIPSSQQQVKPIEHNYTSVNMLRMKPIHGPPLPTPVEQEIIHKKSCENHQMRPLSYVQATPSNIQLLGPFKSLSASTDTSFYQRPLVKPVKQKVKLKKTHVNEQASLVSAQNITGKDVLLGRGRARISHEGNCTYRKLVIDAQMEYVLAKKRCKIAIARRIVAHIRIHDGRFLKLDEELKLYFDVGDKKATDKTSQALREGYKIRRDGKLYIS